MKCFNTLLNVLQIFFIFFNLSLAIIIFWKVQNNVGKEYVCQTCGKEFLGKRRLHNHMISKHPKGQKFVSCEYCGQVSLSIRDCMIKK